MRRKAADGKEQHGWPRTVYGILLYGCLARPEQTKPSQISNTVKKKKESSRKGEKRLGRREDEKKEKKKRTKPKC